MVKNREELVRMANEWMSFAKADLSSQIVSFMEKVGTDINALSEALAISQEELLSIIERRGDIKLSTFAKLLIATDHVVEIKPLSAAPMMSGMPNNSKRTRSAKGQTRRQVSPMEEMPFGMPTPMGMPRDAKGRFIPRTCPPSGYPHPMPMDMQTIDQTRLQGDINTGSLQVGDRRTLISEIRENGWDNELDLINATEDELSRFIQMKKENGQHQSQSEYDVIMDKISNELKRNPHLMQELKKIMA